MRGLHGVVPILRFRGCTRLGELCEAFNKIPQFFSQGLVEKDLPTIAGIIF